MAETPLLWVPRQNNPLWPLPPDYDSMTKEGKRRARVNACRQWLHPVDKVKREVIADCKVGSVRFFDSYYLTADDKADFNPLFYDDEPFPTPEFHDDMTRMAATERAVLGVCPRGSAKSTRCKKDTMLELLSRPAWSTIYATSTHTNAMGFGQSCKEQLFENSRIQDDWSPEYGNLPLRPKRGDKPVAMGYFYLNNGSWLRCISASSRQRGQRPRRYKLDDPEYDESGSTSMSGLRTYMERLLFKVVGPMVTRPGTGVEWWATFVSKQHYAWLAMQVDSEGRAIDPRFDWWARMFVDAIVLGPNGEEMSCWPELWPLKIEDKQKLVISTGNTRYAEVKSLEELEREMGPSVFKAEMRGQPGDAKDSYFGAPEKDKHGWWLTEEDDASINNPHASEATIHWVRDNVPQSMPLPSFLRTCRIFIIGDTSFTSGPASDYKACVCMGINSSNELFVLDVWAMKGQEDPLVNEILKMADRWKAASIHPEITARGYSLYASLNSKLRTRVTEVMGIIHVPKLQPLKPPTSISKEGKISGLLFRFEHGLIKLPFEAKTSTPRRRGRWGMLLEQIEGFNPDAQNGGLANDDLLDSVGSSALILKGVPAARAKEEEGVRSPIDRMMEGEVLDESKLPLILSANLLSMPVSVLESIVSARRKEEANAPSDTRI